MSVSRLTKKLKHAGLVAWIASETLSGVACSALLACESTTQQAENMGREIRRVPANWEHPKTERAYHMLGRMEECYQPLYDEPYSKAIAEWVKNHLLWEDGKHPDQLDGSGKEYRYYAQWSGDAPDVKYYRPEWKPEEMTWYQVYETVSEGTPVSPPFATREELVEYLVANGDFWDQKRGDKAWNRTSAEKFVMGDGWCPSLIVTPQHGVQTGVEALGNQPA